ncbi:TIGR01212 family radical SAM protein [Parasphaerochaeta coccoides]|uniref:Radical SAM domain protein n=1 Tax=Parasphaerochaeta coccoides (strain ATCC BAA-1237 / DSM 17374 / SPN1) TaxID=760011 RepID=F4GI51_PARC1|nr:TIGR01212 family radical SAM protein [Parasphaerochaeta coccoides]AEC02649.1 Radical SAM domain protein [Parasphaerochaeta coccoides DSM 17374]
MASVVRPWTDYGPMLRSLYGATVYRVGVDGGFSCPNRASDRSGGCVFCDGTGASSVYQRDNEQVFAHGTSFASALCFGPRYAGGMEARLSSVDEQIERGKKFLERRYNARLFSLYLQAWTNTWGSHDEMEAVWNHALSRGPWVEFIVSTRPDCVGDTVADSLAACSSQVRKVWAEIGLQSANDATLRRMSRGHGSSGFIPAVKRLHSRGIGVCAHLILGYPGERWDDYEKTVSMVNDSGCEAVKIHNLHIPGGTRLYAEYQQGEIAVASTMRHVEDVIFVLRRLKSDVMVQRLVCETPDHRLAVPRGFADKNKFLMLLQRTMEERNVRQGDLA